MRRSIARLPCAFRPAPVIAAKTLPYAPAGRLLPACADMDYVAHIAAVTLDSWRRRLQLGRTTSASPVIDATRDALANARSRGSTIASLRAITLPEGYEIGGALESERIAAGWHRVGWKLGFTNQALWAALGLDQPFWAPVYAETLASDHLDTVGLVQPRIEPEIVLGVDRDVPAGSGLEEVAASIQWAAAALEVVHCHFEAWEMSPAEAVADAGLHAALAFGPRKKITPSEAIALSACSAVLLRDGVRVAAGDGSEVLGGPLEALGWLLRGLPEGLRAGEMVTTGTLTTALPVSAVSGGRIARRDRSRSQRLN
jgi:2-keto-4-pentenoate hydratase